MKHYFQIVVLVLLLFLWLFIFGPTLLSGPTAHMIFWLVGTLFVVVPITFYIVRKLYREIREDFFKGGVQ